ncbi:hypothetical protein [Thermincola ferriacetica]
MPRLPLRSDCARKTAAGQAESSRRSEMVKVAGKSGTQRKLRVRTEGGLTCKKC